MQYSLTILQAEIKRLEHAIKELTLSLEIIKKHFENKKLIKETIKGYNTGIKIYEAWITELKADINTIQ